MISIPGFLIVVPSVDGGCGRQCGVTSIASDIAYGWRHLYCVEVVTHAVGDCRICKLHHLHVVPPFVTTWSIGSLTEATTTICGLARAIALASSLVGAITPTGEMAVGVAPAGPLPSGSLLVGTASWPSAYVASPHVFLRVVTCGHGPARRLPIGTTPIKVLPVGRGDASPGKGDAAVGRSPAGRGDHLLVGDRSGLGFLIGENMILPL
ncbi:hypothetical protein GW17_00011002 [Ensete ventricosum]|nr:hypothetical protein GW17_00011002 [Ensete ventricosum]